jgi:hypothetical protein
VSDRGKVRSLPRTLSDGRKAGGTILAATPDKDGYLRVSIGGKRLAVHQLVAAAFLGPCPPGQEVRHLRGQQHNGAADLAYGTHAENERDKRRQGDRERNGHIDRNGDAVSRPYLIVTSCDITGTVA